MKITQYDDLYTQKLGAGETTLVSGSSGGSNSAFGGDVVGSAGSLSVVGLRQTVSLSSNLAPSAAVGNVLTLISVGGTPVAQFAVPSNSSVVSFGSNATRVSASSFVGASTNSAREDHRHDGIGTVTASSSNTLDRGTLNLRAGSNVSFGLTDSDGSGGFDTLTINSSAAAAGGGGGTSGALILLEQHTASSSATLDFTTFITSTYDEYAIEVVNLVPATNGAYLGWRAGTGGGPTYDAGANYFYGSTNDSMGALSSGVGNNAQFGQVSFSGRLFSPQSTAQMKQLVGMATFHDGAHVSTGLNGSLWASITALTAVRFMFSAGNITSGTIRIYGIAKT